MTRTVAHTNRIPALAGCLLTAAFLVTAPRTAAAQDASKVYELNEVSSMPKLSSPSETARIINGAYPEQLRRSGVGGTVQMEFVVQANGKVDVSTVEVAATVAALGDAAKSVAGKLEFQPATVKGTPVKSRVVLPLLFKP
jgi:TonB family protein